MDNNRETAHNVIDMTDFQPHRDFAPLAQVEAYWEALRNGRDMPRRAEIDPRGIETALENAFILERVAPGLARLRIAGSHLHDIMGMEVRGMPLTSFFAGPVRDRIGQLLEEVFQAPALAEIALKSAAKAGREVQEARMLLLPLRSDLGDVSRILGCMVARAPLGDCPPDYVVEDIHLRPIDADGHPVAEPAPQRSPSGAESGNGGFSDPSGRFDHKPGDKRPPYLRLVKSDPE
ncbi:PAS domain-containing protein [Sulfitobacter sp. HNIBRBA3233]|uniref:PAS domain-containing protein n=1 Tax=Sulfitobacter marinivivus TaxID=3158558 RepID=UPI0032DFF555